MPMRPKTSKISPKIIAMAAMGAKNELVETARIPMTTMNTPVIACHNGVGPMSALWVPAGLAAIIAGGIVGKDAPHAKQNVEPGAIGVPQRLHADITHLCDPMLDISMAD